MDLPLGTPPPSFSLPDPDGKVFSLGDFADAKAILIAFVCNHCPFVVAIKEELARIDRDYRERGLAMVAINSNNVDQYPADSPEKMKEFAAESGWGFPYLFDESQEVAKAYRAACTPDFYLFSHEKGLFYRGQLDRSRPKNEESVDGSDLRRALEALLAGEKPPADQIPSAGCNIKWKPGNAPDYFG